MLTVQYFNDIHAQTNITSSVIELLWGGKAKSDEGADEKLASIPGRSVSN